MWLLLVYKVPPEPSARRVYVWRKLKAMGALLLHDSVWVLPRSDRTQEKLQWLAGEIQEMEGGEALLWQADQLFTGGGSDLARRFGEQVDALYQAILDSLAAPDADLAALSRQYQQASGQDYFGSELGRQVRAALIGRRGGEQE
jgi:hypothetical protein